MVRLVKVTQLATRLKRLTVMQRESHRISQHLKAAGYSMLGLSTMPSVGLAHGDGPLTGSHLLEHVIMLAIVVACVVSCHYIWRKKGPKTRV